MQSAWTATRTVTACVARLRQHGLVVPRLSTYDFAVSTPSATEPSDSRMASSFSPLPSLCPTVKLRDFSDEHVKNKSPTPASDKNLRWGVLQSVTSSKGATRAKLCSRQWVCTVRNPDPGHLGQTPSHES